MTSQQYTATLEALRRTRSLRYAARRQRLVPWAMVTTSLFIAASATRVKPGPGLHGKSLGVTLALAAFGAGVLAGVWWLGTRASPGQRAPARLFVPAAGLITVSSAVLGLLQPKGSGQVGMFIGMAVAIRMMTRRQSAILVAACLVYLLIRVQLLAAVALAGMFMLTVFGSRIVEQDAQADRLLAELDEHRGAELRAAALAERQRLARDMHDVLAHSLSGLLLQLEGARLLATASDAEPRLTKAIEQAHALAKDGLAEARQAIGMLREGELRDDELPGPDALAALTAAFCADTGVRGEFAVTGLARELAPEVRLALYRVTQEGLTNIRKHAAPDRVDVRLAYLPAEVTLAVEDQADPAPRPSQDQGGYGLTGMRERAALLGGTLTAAPTGHGFLVELRVPA